MNSKRSLTILASTLVVTLLAVYTFASYPASTVLAARAEARIVAIQPKPASSPIFEQIADRHELAVYQATLHAFWGQPVSMVATTPGGAFEQITDRHELAAYQAAISGYMLPNTVHIMDHQIASAR
jgi:hypothetical protein